MDGAIVVDKPEGWTSHDTVNKIRRFAGTKKVGHLGTLDPIATGVLPLVIGRATRLAQFYARSEKTYEMTVRFGFSTDSYDRSGIPTSPQTEPVITPGDLERFIGKFRGDFLQTPPPVSAKKVAGTPAYKLARKQIAVTLAPVEVSVSELTVLGIEGSEARMRVRCSAGTYMRAIAHELGEAMSCGAHVSGLRRAASGEFSLEQALTISELEFFAATGRLVEALIPAARMLPEFPTVFVEPVTVGQIRQGRDFTASTFQLNAGSLYVKAVSREGELIAVGKARLPRLYHPIVVL